MLFLESAELRVKDRKCLTLDFWKGNIDSLLSFQGYDILQGNGSISNSDMEKHVKLVYEEFDSKRKQIEAELADAEDLKWLEDLQSKIKNKKGIITRNVAPHVGAWIETYLCTRDSIKLGAVEN